MVHTYTMRRPIIPYNPKLKERARYLRNNSTKAEAFLWNFLKGKQIHGFDFHRQRPVDNYIIDFFCQELYLAIELDGYSHLLVQSEKSDQYKEERLTDLGVKLIRFWDDEVFNDLDNVLRVIEITVLERSEELGD
jgi:very-short-patch-repair endonuclease